MKVGIRHPDQVVETSSLASVEPPEVWYRMAIPESIIDYGYLSALQLESITYACQKHDTILPSGHRAGYLIGELTIIRANSVMLLACVLTFMNNKKLIIFIINLRCLH